MAYDILQLCISILKQVLCYYKYAELESDYGSKESHKEQEGNERKGNRRINNKPRLLTHFKEKGKL
jgi:hypothetical protein